MAKKINWPKLLNSTGDIFGPAAVRHFDRLPKDCLKKMEFRHWYQIFVTASEVLENGKIKTILYKNKLMRIKKRALSVILKK